ncbi:FAD-dependent oxidoreductase [Actinosynnema sp. NPDC047251]|uniref:Ferredoxin reductase n=1 Tax=Saccharothrix espanaensis (strain ATCC 51144 / DSM 44229 / JCM 9112 / NBRC 15066 / NRRL 15764) TaxID=1179773 RepID=K0K7V8_SACES|nr:FAD-dependent oxidoreductase [Saccharothrix espanaensis]CCH32738.1 Ferredoxin reductase [Saccharothrix espanaensis DSM 44229]
MSTPPSLVVVGASLAGLRAVEAARGSGFDGAITLVGDEPHLPYNRPPLSKEFLATGVGPDYFRTETSLRDDLGVDLRLGAPATALDTGARVVVAGGAEIRYTAAVLATGAAARALPGTAGLSCVHSLRGIDDARGLHAKLVPGARAVVVGAGFVGAEVAVTARRRGVEVTVVEAAPVPLVRAVGPEMGAALAGLLAGLGVPLLCGTGVESVTQRGNTATVRLADGRALVADVVVVGIGAAPATGWLAGSGVELGDGVLCEPDLATTAAAVYAAGDVARWHNPVFGTTMRLEHWTTAAEQGATAGRNAVSPGTARPCATVPYFWSDWGGHRIRFAGIPDADEVAVVQGDPAADSFVALYRRGDRLTGALGLNRNRAVVRLRAAIARGVTWSDAVTSVHRD